MNRLIFLCCTTSVLLLSSAGHGTASQDVGAAIPSTEEEVRETGPVELLFLFSVRSDFRKLLTLGDEVSQTVGSSEWQSDDLLFSLVNAIDLRKFVQAQQDAPCLIQYDIYLTVPVSGSEDYSQAVVIAAPVTLLADEEAMGIDITKAEPDGEGFALLQVDQEHFLMLKDGDMAFMIYIEDGVYADERTLLSQTRERFLRNPPTHACEVFASPQRIRRSLRQPFADMAIASLSAVIQRRDSEDELTFRGREVWGKSIAELIDLIANQLESVRYSVDPRTAQQGVEITLAIEAVKDSAFAAWLKRQRNARSSTIRYLHPAASCSCLMNFALPEVLQQTLPAFAEAAVRKLREASLVSASAASEISSAVQNLASRGRFELLLQFVPDGAGRQSIIACIPLYDSPDFSNAAIELVSLVQQEGVVVAAQDISGFPVHQYPMDAGQLLPHADLAQFVATDNALMLFVGPADAAPLLSEVVRTDFDKHPDSDLWHRKGFVAQTSLTSLLRILEVGDDDDFRSTYVGNLDESVISRHDTISLVMQHDDTEVELSATFDQFASAVGIAAFSGTFTAALEGFEF
jgi:hypothetical protein